MYLTLDTIGHLQALIPDFPTIMGNHTVVMLEGDITATIQAYITVGSRFTV